MKKAIGLGIIFLMIVSVCVYAQDFAAMQKELMQVQQDVASGKITQAQAAIRMNEINQKYLGGKGTIGGGSSGEDYGAIGRAQDAQQERYRQQQQQAYQTPAWMQEQLQKEQSRQGQYVFPTGEKSGWPLASIFRQCNLPSLRQPAGTTATYTWNPDTYILEIYMQKGTERTANDLLKAVDSKHADKSFKNASYGVGLDMPKGLNKNKYNSYRVEVSCEEGGVILRTVTRYLAN
jgi:hypothetical protein